MSKHAQASRRATLAAVPPSASYLALVITMEDDEGNPRVAWETFDGDPQEIRIERRMNGGSWVQIITAYGDDYGYTDDSLLLGVGDDFDYRAVPYYLDGNAPWSNVVSCEAYSSP